MEDLIKQIADGRVTTIEVIERLEGKKKKTIEKFLDEMKGEAVVLLMPEFATAENVLRSERLIAIADAVAYELFSDSDKAKKPNRRESDALMKLQGLTDIYDRLKDEGFIVEGYWEGSPACFWTLVYELHMNYGIDNAGLPWTPVAQWVNVREDDQVRLIKSAQKGYKKNNENGTGAKKSIVPRAAIIRAICKK